MAEPLTPDQQALADRIHATLVQATAADLRQIAELLAAKSDGDLLGRTEFDLRDRALKIGAAALEAALAERKKGGTTAPPPPAPAAPARPSSTAGGRRPS
jgi:hypothetical protein